MWATESQDSNLHVLSGELCDAHAQSMLLALCHDGLWKHVKGQTTQYKITSPSYKLEDTTTVLSGTLCSILAPGEVSPGHMMFAPLNTNLMAPLSTCNWGNMCGSTGAS